MSPRKKQHPTAFRSNRDIAIHVPDLDRAAKFYSDVLRFRLISRSRTQLHFDTGTFDLWVNLDDAARSFVPSFDVSDYKAAVEHLAASGCKMIAAGAATYLQDPFGFLFDVIETPQERTRQS
jgi:catechol 2,3-dioxygenase-like lactoylglutathione lyase family enzyme